MSGSASAVPEGCVRCPRCERVLITSLRLIAYLLRNIGSIFPWTDAFKDPADLGAVASAFPDLDLDHRAAFVRNELVACVASHLELIEDGELGRLGCLVCKWEALAPGGRAADPTDCQDFKDRCTAMVTKYRRFYRSSVYLGVLPQDSAAVMKEAAKQAVAR